jgi:hypothetical protein
MLVQFRQQSGALLIPNASEKASASQMTGGILCHKETIGTVPSFKVSVAELDLSRFCAAPSARLGHLSFESDGAFPAQC